MNETTKPKRPYCPKCNSVYYITVGCRTLIDREKNEKHKIKFAILGCQCDEILLYNRTMHSWQEFPFKFTKFPIFDKKKRKLVFV